MVPPTRIYMSRESLGNTQKRALTSPLSAKAFQIFNCVVMCTPTTLCSMPRGTEHLMLLWALSTSLSQQLLTSVVPELTHVSAPGSPIVLCSLCCSHNLLFCRPGTSDIAMGKEVVDSIQFSLLSVSLFRTQVHASTTGCTENIFSPTL